MEMGQITGGSGSQVRILEHPPEKAFVFLGLRPKSETEKLLEKQKNHSWLLLKEGKGTQIKAPGGWGWGEWEVDSPR